MRFVNTPTNAEQIITQNDCLHVGISRAWLITNDGKHGGRI